MAHPYVAHYSSVGIFVVLQKFNEYFIHYRGGINNSYNIRQLLALFSFRFRSTYYFMMLYISIDVHLVVFLFNVYVAFFGSYLEREEEQGTRRKINS